jgi:hypothetical protein
MRAADKRKDPSGSAPAGVLIGWKLGGDLASNRQLIRILIYHIKANS